MAETPEQVAELVVGDIDWTALLGDSKAALAQQLRDAGRKALAKLELTDDESLVDQVSAEAETFADARAAELITEIAETTRARLRALVSDAITQGLSAPDLRRAVSDSYDFTPERASRIARTELAFAHSRGNLAAWQASDQVVGTRSLLGSNFDDANCSGGCQENADAGVIALGDVYPSGDECAPYHPQCVCDNVPVLKPAREVT